MAESHVASHFPNSTLPPCRWFQVAVGALNAIEAPVADFHSDLTEAGPGLRSPKSFTVSQEIWVDKWQALCYHIKHSSLLLVYKHQCVHKDLKHSHLNWSLRRNGKITDNAIFFDSGKCILGRNSGERYRSCVWRAVLEAFRLIFIFAPLRLNDFEHEQVLAQRCCCRRLIPS